MESKILKLMRLKKEKSSKSFFRVHLDFKSLDFKSFNLKKVNFKSFDLKGLISKVGIVSLLLIGGQLSLAQSKRTLTLEEAKKMSLKVNEDIKVKSNEVESAKAQVREAWGTIYPQVAIDGRWQKYYKPPVFFGNPIPIDYQLESSLSVKQVLWAFGRVSGALNAAKAGVTMGEMSQRATTIETLYNTSMAYYAALLAQEQLKITKLTLNNAKENLRILEKKFSGGRPPQGDLVRLKSDEAIRSSQLTISESEYMEALSQLARLVGEGDSEDLHLATPFRTQFPQIKLPSLQKQLQETHPQLKAMREHVELRSEIARVQGAADLPTLAAFGSYNYSGASDRGLTNDDLFESVVGGVVLTWNLWDGGQSRAKHRQAVLEKANAELSFEKTKLNMGVELKKTVIQYQGLVSSYEKMKEAVSLAERSFKISQGRFRTGQASITELNSAELALTQAHLNLTLNVFNIHASMAKLEMLSATEQEL